MYHFPQDVPMTPVGPLVNLTQLLDVPVAATPFDDPVYRHDIYVGVITEVKINKWGTFARFKTPELVGQKWIRLERVLGFVHTAAATAA